MKVKLYSSIIMTIISIHCNSISMYQLVQSMVVCPKASNSLSMTIYQQQAIVYDNYVDLFFSGDRKGTRVQTYFGDTALHYAIRQNNVEQIGLLVCNGADYCLTN